MGQDPNKTASRRGFLKKTAATALAVGAGPAFIVPGRAQQKTLRILKWKNFVPEFDRWFNETFVRAWGDRNDTRVVVDSIGLGELSGRAAAEVEAQEGHDLVLLLTPASAFQDGAIDHREIFEESVRRYGQPFDVALKSCHDPHTGKHNGLCTSILPALITYRSDLWGEIGRPPDSWDDVRRGGRKIRLLHDKPVGISLAPEHNSEHSLRAIMYSFGSSIQDSDGNPSLKSEQTLEAIKFTKALFDEAMPADVLGWNAVSNNQFMLSAEGCLTLDTLSIVRASETKRMPVADNLRLAMLPSGPAGRVGPSFGIDNFVIWKFSQNIDGAANFLLDLIGLSRDIALVSGFQHLPSYPDAVEDLESLMTTDETAAVPDQYSLLKDVDTWVTNVGYPGFANPAIGEILGARLISRMFAAAATGELTPDEAMVQADQEVRRIFDRWRS
jgi:multiple sugar transport system substrate-binding protein